MRRFVCFDVGGVLVEINHNWKGALLDSGMSEVLADRFDHALVEFAAFNDFQKGTVCWEDYCIALGGYLEGLSPKQAEQVHNAILKVAYPGIPELIAELHQAGVQTGCISNTNAPHWESFFNEPRLAMLRAIQVPLASHLIGAEKPDSAMYRAFEDASGARPEEIVYFDDSLENVEAARKLSWTAFRIDPSGNPAEQMRARLREVGWL